MKKTLLLFLSFAFIIVAMAQNKVVKDANATVRKVDEKFNAINVAGGIQLWLSQGNQQVAVSANNVDDRDKIVTKVENGLLKIYYDNGTTDRAGKGKSLRVYVSATEIKSIEGSAGANIKIDGSLSSNELSLNLSSGSSFSGGVKTNKTIVDQSSGSVASVSGTGSELVVKTGSGAIFKGYGFEVKNCNADVSSGGDIETNVSEALTASASSGGKIRYKGNGNIVKISTGSGGSVNKSNN